MNATSERDRLIEEHWQTAAYYGLRIYRRLGLRVSDHEDAQQEAVLSMIDAVAYHIANPNPARPILALIRRAIRLDIYKRIGRDNAERARVLTCADQARSGKSRVGRRDFSSPARLVELAESVRTVAERYASGSLHLTTDNREELSSVARACGIRLIVDVAEAAVVDEIERAHYTHPTAPRVFLTAEEVRLRRVAATKEWRRKKRESDPGWQARQRSLRPESVRAYHREASKRSRERKALQTHR